MAGARLPAQESKTTIFETGSPEYGRGLEKMVVLSNSSGMVIRQEMYYRADKRLVMELTIFDELGVRTKLEYRFTDAFVKTNGYDREFHSWKDGKETVEYFYTMDYTKKNGKIKQILEYEDKKLKFVSTWWNDDYSTRFGMKQTLAFNESGDLIEKKFFFTGSTAREKGKERTEFFESGKLRRILMVFPEKNQELSGERQIHIFRPDGTIEQLIIIFPDSIAKEKGKKQILYFDERQKSVKCEFYDKKDRLLTRKKLD
jgi:hypothetical protein